MANDLPGEGARALDAEPLADDDVGGDPRVDDRRLLLDDRAVVEDRAGAELRLRADERVRPEVTGGLEYRGARDEGAAGAPDPRRPRSRGPRSLAYG